MSRQLVGAQHPVHQMAQPVGLADDDAGVFAQRRVRQLPLQQLRRPAQAPQRILDLVRQIAHQRPGGVVLGQNVLLAADSQPPVHLPQFQQQFSGWIAFQQRCGGAIHGHDPLQRKGQLQLPFNVRMTAFQTVPQSGDERFGAENQFRQRQLVRLTETQLKQRLRRRIHEQQPQAPIQHQYGDAQAFHHPALIISQHGRLVLCVSPEQCTLIVQRCQRKRPQPEALSQTQGAARP